MTKFYIPQLAVYPRAPTFPGNITPPDQAIYIPAISPPWAIAIQGWITSGLPRALPFGVTASDLNILDLNNTHFRISYGLTSAGLGLNQNSSSIITTRDRKRTFMFADSGGYQIAGNRLKVQNDADRMRILRWQEQFDAAMTLDVPTGPLSKGGYRYKTFQDCLDATLIHLDFYQKNKSSTSNVIWLNVLQGNDPAQCDDWYQAVRKRFDGQGWAFAGPLRHNFYYLLRRLIIMLQDGELQKKRWIHVLGTCELDTAVLLTALQRSLNKHVNKEIRVSYDTSTPFRMLRFNSAYTLPSFTSKGMTMQARPVPNSARHIGMPVRWPWPSPIGDRMMMNDFCVSPGPNATGYRDAVSNVLLAHHNLSALCYGVALANRVFDAETLTGQHTIAYRVGDAVHAIDAVLKNPSIGTLQAHKAIFARLKHGQIDPDSEAERDF
ncbi:MAG: hypothetical protein KIT85_19340 [Pseudolabrys sp.]|nr:hypothetical protein [Pseudolabrys sp.]